METINMKKARTEMGETDTMETMETAMVTVPTTTTDIETIFTTVVAEKVRNAAKPVDKMNLEENVEIETGDHNKEKKAMQ